METREDILKELKELAPHLASLQKVDAFQVPESYFQNFYNMLLLQVKPVDVKQELLEIGAAHLSAIKPSTAQLPASYFAGFSARLLNKVRAEDVAKELSAIAPRLSVIKKANTLTAPANYFKSFPEIALANINAKKQQHITTPANWVTALNELLDSIAAVIFKPRYTVALAGITTIVIMGVFMLVKVQQYNDLDTRFAQLSTEEINNYLDNKSDAYSDEVFEMNLDTKTINSNPNLNNVHAYKDALKDVDDESLNEAIAD